MFEIVSEIIPKCLFIESSKYHFPELQELLEKNTEIYSYNHQKDTHFIDENTSVPILTVEVSNLNKEHLNLLEKKGILIAWAEKTPEPYQYEFFVNNTIRATARIFKGKIILIGIKGTSFMSGKHTYRMRLFQEKFLHRKPPSLEEYPVTIKIKPEKNYIAFKSIDQVLENLRNQMNKNTEEQIKIKTSFTMESLAPPKDGHILMMLASGMADGHYGNLIIKGTSRKKTISELDENNRKITREIPQIVIKAVNKETLEYFEIV